MTSSTRLTCVTGVALVTLAGLLYVAFAQFGGSTAAPGAQPAGTWSRLLVGGGGLLLTAILLLNELALARTGCLLRAIRHQRETGDWSHPVPVAGDDDVAELAAEFNRRSEELANSQANEQSAQAKHDAGHQAASEWARAFAASPAAHCICTLNELRCLEANESFLNLIGWERGQVIEQSDLNLKLWPDTHARDSWWELVRDQRSVRDVECTLSSSAGELLTVAASAEVVTFAGRECVLWTCYDLTERSNREIHARQAQKLEAITKLAAGFAHDFNNLLCVIQGHTSLLQTEPTMEPSSLTSLKQITTAAERGANLTRQLLTFSRKQVIKPNTLDLNLVIHGMSNMLLRTLGEDIALRFDFSGDVPLIQADTGMLEQIIMNLVMNARDAMPKGGQVTVHTSAFAVDAHYVRLKPEARVGNFACLSVADTGRGLEPSAVNRIFEPFFTTKDVGKGSGLGLATAYGIVQQHKGWIEVVSQPGQGTTFKIFLPATDVAAETETPSAKPAPFTQVGGKEKILLVEDEPGLLALVQSILERYGYRIVTANNGMHALEVWEELDGKVDLLVTDVVMPEGLTGCQLVEKLRVKNPKLKVIFTSGYSADLVGATEEELIEGVNFIQKPYRPQVLAQTVRTRLDGGDPQTAKKISSEAA